MVAESFGPIDKPDVTMQGRLERAQLYMRPSKALQEHLLAFVKPSLREGIGRRGLFLYSNYSKEVHRRPGGALKLEDALMEREFRAIEQSGAGQMRLRESVITKEMSSPKTGDRFAIGLIAQLGSRATELVLTSPHISNKLLINAYGGMPIHTSFPMKAVIPEEFRGPATEGLERFVFGRSLEVGENISSRLSHNRQAHVTDLRLRYYTPPPPPDNVRQLRPNTIN